MFSSSRCGGLSTPIISVMQFFGGVVLSQFVGFRMAHPIENQPVQRNVTRGANRPIVVPIAANLPLESGRL